MEARIHSLTTELQHAEPPGRGEEAGSIAYAIHTIVDQESKSLLASPPSTVTTWVYPLPNSKALPRQNATK